MSVTDRTDAWLAGHAEWSAVLKPLLRELRASGLDETIKWGVPVFTAGGRNVVALVAFKAYAGLWFYEGAALADPAGVLINAQQGKTRDLRQWRFRPDDTPDPALVRDYVHRAVALAGEPRAASTAKASPTPPPAGGAAPEELAQALADDDELRRAFDALTPGRQREIIAWIAAAKRVETRVRRVARVVPMIRRGEGLSDRYRR